jgi:hypothetical protein
MRQAAAGIVSAPQLLSTTDAFPLAVRINDHMTFRGLSM